MKEFMSPDGAVPAPGGPANDTEEDTEGGFAHGGSPCRISTPTSSAQSLLRA